MASQLVLCIQSIRFVLDRITEKASSTVQIVSLGSLSKDVFERRTSTGSEAFSLFICLDTTKFVLLSVFSPIKTLYQRVSTKPQPNAAKSPLPVDVRRSKTLLLKLSFNCDDLPYTCFFIPLFKYMKFIYSFSFLIFEPIHSPVPRWPLASFIG